MDGHKRHRSEDENPSSKGSPNFDVCTRSSKMPRVDDIYRPSGSAFRSGDTPRRRGVQNSECHRPSSHRDTSQRRYVRETDRYRAPTSSGRPRPQERRQSRRRGNRPRLDTRTTRSNNETSTEKDRNSRSFASSSNEVDSCSEQRDVWRNKGKDLQLKAGPSETRPDRSLGYGRLKPYVFTDITQEKAGIESTSDAQPVKASSNLVSIGARQSNVVPHTEGNRLGFDARDESRDVPPRTEQPPPQKSWKELVTALVERERIISKS